MKTRPAALASFDFELGNLLESPCKRCYLRACLPECANECELIDSVQKMLAGGISSAQSCSPAESYSLLIND